jgi:hypothetical protein
MSPSHKPPTLINLPFEIRQKILMIVMEEEIDELILKDIVCQLQELDIQRFRTRYFAPKVPDAAHIRKWASRMSSVHGDIGRAIDYVLKKALEIYCLEKRQVVQLVQENNILSLYKYFLGGAEVIFTTGLPESQNDFTKKICQWEDTTTEEQSYNGECVVSLTGCTSLI